MIPYCVGMKSNFLIWAFKSFHYLSKLFSAHLLTLLHTFHFSQTCLETPSNGPGLVLCQWLSLTMSAWHLKKNDSLPFHLVIVSSFWCCFTNLTISSLGIGTGSYILQNIKQLHTEWLLRVFGQLNVLWNC